MAHHSTREVVRVRKLIFLSCLLDYFHAYAGQAKTSPYLQIF
ncbi:hypothetical protein ACOJUR_09715 [Alicyclobacillus tolerans]|uniref:Uncharacterized protein n=1 Tax=Alicyclobacillus tolerans TaxID=90970 RepID=A0ABT9LV03_9BACL|nr:MULTISPECIES: hypothetical protein [Alicyclobacillus]MDP9728108.1 hypothetical protein [Alicyclobacillus tengchongensis]